MHLLGILGDQELLFLAVLVIAIVIIIAVNAGNKTNTNSTAGVNDHSTASGYSSSGQVNYSTVVVNEGKSTGLAFLLTFLFGPLGLFYVSISGGIIMILVSIVVGALTLGYGLIITWIICMIWAVSAAGETKTTSTVVSSTIPTGHSSVGDQNMKKNPSQTIAANPSNKEGQDSAAILQELSQLHDLKQKGVLTEDIYEQQKARLLQKLSDHG